MLFTKTMLNPLGSPCMHAWINASIIAAQCLYLSRDGHRFKVHFETFFTKWFFKAKNETRLTNRFEKSFWLISVVRIKILHKIINLSSLYFWKRIQILVEHFKKSKNFECLKTSLKRFPSVDHFRRMNWRRRGKKCPCINFMKVMSRLCFPLP